MLDSLRANRASSLSAACAALIASLFLSFICCAFHNLWLDDIARIIREEGDWHARIVCAPEESLQTVCAFAHVASAQPYETASGERGLSIRFDPPGRTYEELSLILARLGLPQSAAQTNRALLSRYLVYAPGDPNPPLLLPLYIVIFSLAALSMMGLIRCALSVSQEARLHQYGILQSVGATPGQLIGSALGEALLLSLLPALAGTAAGTGLCRLFVAFGASISVQLGATPAAFVFDPLVPLLAFACSIAVVLLSMLGSAVRLLRLSPIAAIRGSREPDARKAKPVSPAFRPFGPIGELAAHALRRQRRALRPCRISFTCSFLSLALFSCFLSMSRLSVDLSYFERYQNAWDLIVSLPAPPDAQLLGRVSSLPGVRRASLHGRASCRALVMPEEQSEALWALGGLLALDSALPVREDGAAPAHVELLFLDEASFSAYWASCPQRLTERGAILVNAVWDSAHSRFHSRAYVPYLSDVQSLSLIPDGQEEPAFDLPLAGFADEPPLLREAYDEHSDYPLVLILPDSMLPDLSAAGIRVPSETTLTLLAQSEADIPALEEALSSLLGSGATIENRLREKQANDSMYDGMQLFMGVFCALLALSGAASVFSCALGFLMQRRREFARYLSLGLTPGGMAGILALEAASIALSPVLITLPLVGAFIVFAARQSGVALSLFAKAAPVPLLLLFALGIALCVAAAYGIGGRRLLSCDLAGALRDDTQL
ncbi:MAG: ABC transporter permease [Clostridia bacterium]|nr:ABC transporter permease [Clostridia bacterium]